MTAPHRTPAPWRGRDVLLFLLLFLPAGLIADVLVAGVVHVAGAAHGGATGRAAESLAGEVAFYAADLALILALLRRRGAADLRLLGWRRPLRWAWVAWTPAITLGTLVLAAILSAPVERLLPHATNGQCSDVKSAFGNVVALAIPAVVVVAPIVEETVFRGFVFGWLRAHMAVGPAALLSALIFAGAHVEGYFYPPLLPALAGVGVVLALLYTASDSLLASAAVHGLFNLAGLIAIVQATSC